MQHPTPRRGRALIDAARPFAREDRARSWFHVVSTLAVLAAAALLAALASWWPLRIAGAVLETLVFVRAFILYHDHLHGALLRDSRLARALFGALGLFMLTPPRVWAHTHNFHHANTARLTAAATGTFTLWSVDRWQAASWRERTAYRLERSPLTILFGYVTVFLVGMCVLPFARDPRRNAAAGVAAVLHVGVIAATWRLLGGAACVAAVLGPYFAAYAFGAYLFYAQHNAPGIALAPAAAWNHGDAAVDGSTYLATSRVMRWFTGNIGYHHVHHLNARIPFYRLPEAMAAIPELQTPVVTTLHPRDVAACLRLALWDPSRGRMVGFADVPPRVAIAARVAVPLA
jgi:omega-6 fatty acid desaturase (delta-12 desaturase)